MAKTTIRLLLFFFISALSLPAFAGAIFDFPISSGGSFNLEVRNHRPRSWGAGIRVKDLKFGSSADAVFGGRLSFSTGAFGRLGGDNISWGAGGRLTIRGCADLNHDGKCDKGDFKGVLLTGKFLHTELIQQNGREVLIAHLIDQLNPQLAAILHLPNSSLPGNLELSMIELQSGRWWTHSGVRSGSLTDYVAVPESSSIWLLGVTLVCCVLLRFGMTLGYFMKRRNSANVSSS
jgi:hypothetical protein